MEHNPFVDLVLKPETAETDPFTDANDRKQSENQRRQKRDAIYKTYSPMVEEVLDQLISVTRPINWIKGSDITHQYCCHINWYAGPEEVYKINYDDHHIIRRRIEITLEQDSACNPTGFKVLSHEHINKSIHVGLSREELISGIKEVLS